MNNIKQLPLIKSKRRKIIFCSFSFIRKSILILIFISFSQKVYTQFKTPIFEYFSSEDGLPENSVTCILQDHLGYLWFGTQNGLAKYDGYSMKNFFPGKNDSSSISDGYIVSIFEDNNNTLWIGTANGLNKFDRIKETFTCYKPDSDNKNSLNSSYIKCIYEDQTGKFWVGTDDGLNLFDREKQTFTQYFFKDSDSQLYKSSIPNKHKVGVNALIEEPGSGDLLVGPNADGLWKFNKKERVLSKYKFNIPNIPEEKIGKIQSFCKSRDGKIWMASWHTLSCLDVQKKEVKFYFDFPILPQELRDWSSCTHGAVIEDRSGLIWCGFYSVNKGIFCLNPKSERFWGYKIYPDMSGTSKYNMVYSLYEDNSGIIWIGTWLSGLAKCDRRKYKFRLLKNDNRADNTLSDSRVYSLNYDPKGFVWFGTSKSLDKYNLREGIYNHYLKNEASITKNNYTASIDKSGNIWIGTAKGGLIKFNPINKAYHFYCNDPKDSINLINKRILTLIEDHLGVLWIGTQYYGLFKYEVTKNNLIQYRHDPNDATSLSENRVNIIYEDSFNTLWIGTNLGGLEKFDRNTGKFIHCGMITILEIFEDSDNNLWVADYTTGLNLFDRKKCEVTVSYGQKDGLAHNAIQGILEDDHKNLWIGTDVGFSKFSIEKRTFRNYTKEDGLPANRFLWPCCKDGNGIMYFKTEAGLISFHPDNVKDDPIPPKVVLSNISLFNRPGEKLDYKGFIPELKEINLPYNQNDLRFDYVGLHFSEPAKNKYKYILENFDEDWVDAGTQRNATYTNLDPGKYIFKVKAANKDGIWNETNASITIIITPPWWDTTYAYILYTLIIVSILYVTWRLQIKRIRVRHEFEMSKFESEKLHEVDDLKSRFFTNISHEFRTPLTLILGPVKQMIERAKDGKTRNELQVVHKNAKSLLGLVNELLDISKLESGNMTLQASPQNIVPLLKALVQSFCSYAERKKINLKFNSQKDAIIAYIDKEKIEKIITNLLSNAFKFTPEEGEIEVKASLKIPSIPPLIKEELKEGFVEISIRDNGIGIPKENIPKIFDRFYQVDGSHKREQEGTGIGLSLTKELIELHKGKIEVESEEGKGTVFIISIPFGKEHLLPEQICDAKQFEPSHSSVEPTFIDEDKLEKPGLAQLIETEKPILLIVEDNYDVRNYIKNNLKNDYKIIEAINGEDGWNKSIESALGGPDLIISDVMMPKMDGFELCKKLKTDERTSHIPVILLTAKASSQDKIEGFETGADEYIMKPFEPDELNARIKNLIEQRKRIHEYFKKHGIYKLEESKINSADKKFLKKVFDAITENMSNPTFNVETLSELIAVSRSVLHKKIVSLIGEPPVEVIRRIRVTMGAELIEKKFGNISEIALEVGFNNPAHFSEYFKKQFGVTPSQYLHKI